jgi:hypothetical protein
MLATARRKLDAVSEGVVYVRRRMGMSGCSRSLQPQMELIDGEPFAVDIGQLETGKFPRS